MKPLFLSQDGPPDAPNPTQRFYGLGTPFKGTFESFNLPWYGDVTDDGIEYKHNNFKDAAATLCNDPWNAGPPENTNNKANFILARKCTNAVMVTRLMEDSRFGQNGTTRNNFWLPETDLLRPHSSWTMGAAALIARATDPLSNNAPPLRGCNDDAEGLEVIGIFNASSVNREDTFVAPTVQPALDNESYDQIFTTNTLLIKSSNVPVSAKFLHSSDNDFVTIHISSSVATFVLFAVILLSTGVLVYRFGRRRSSSPIFLPTSSYRVKV